MVTMLVISLLMVVVFVAAATVRNKELPDSISAIVWLLSSYKWVWSIWLWAVSLTACIPLIEAMPENWKFLAFLTLVCLFFLGAMPLFVKDSVRAHCILGVCAGIFSQVCVAVMSPWWLLLWTPYVALVTVLTFAPQSRGWVAWLYSVVKGKGVLLLELSCILTEFTATLCTLI